MIWVWVNTYRYIFSGMNIHKSQLFWGSPGVPGFWPIPTLAFLFGFSWDIHGMWWGYNGMHKTKWQWKGAEKQASLNYQQQRFSGRINDLVKVGVNRTIHSKRQFSDFMLHLLGRTTGVSTTIASCRAVFCSRPQVCCRRRFRRVASRT